MRVNPASTGGGGGGGGGVAAGVYPGILKVNSRDAADFEKYAAGDSTDGFLVPVNFSATPQALIDAAVTDVLSKYSGGNHIKDDGEATKWRFGNWVISDRVKHIKIAPFGKVRESVNNPWATSSYYCKSVMIDTNKILVIWPVYYASNQYHFYAKAGTIGAGGITWGADARVGTIVSNNYSETYWAIAKQATDKAIIYFSDQTNSNFFSASCFTVSGTTIGSAGATLQIAATASTIVYSATYAASDKSIVKTNITADYAYVCTTSGTTITAGAGVDVIGTGSNIQTILQYVEDNKILCAYGNAANSGFMYARILTISGTVISPQAEASVNTGGGVSMSMHNVQMLSTTLGIFHAYGSSYNNWYAKISISGVAVTLTGLTSATFPFHGNTSPTYLAADQANNECWAIGHTNGRLVYKIIISGSSLTLATPGSADYSMASTALTIQTSGSIHQQFCISGPNGIGIYIYNTSSGQDANKILVQAASETQVDIAINGVSAYDATTPSIGQICAINADISDDGYAEITLTNDLGTPAAFMFDEMLITCT